MGAATPCLIAAVRRAQDRASEHRLVKSGNDPVLFGAKRASAAIRGGRADAAASEVH